MAAKLTRLAHKIEIQMHSSRELYHLQFSLQTVSQQTFGYTLVSGLGAYGSGQGTEAAPCEHGNELSGSTKDGDFFFTS
jgi:hypothetical protein